MTLDECRRFYAEEIRYAANVESGALVEAFARVPRENFLGSGPWQIVSPGRDDAIVINDPRHVYHNVLIALDSRLGLNNGQPGFLARCIDALDLRTGDRVFHVGCGVGYYTAIMAEVVGVGGRIVACEVHSDLASRAKVNLGIYANVTVHTVDGATFDPGQCDAMLINAGVTHPHRPWLERLSEGGRIVLPITVAAGEKTPSMGLMLKITREQGQFGVQIVSEVAIYPCTNVRDPRLEPIIEKALANKTLLKLKSVRLEPHEQAETCILHRGDVCLSRVDPASASTN